ncbi:MAG: methyltransferase domain-containing protein [Firmicutes bacterium]|jgi:2-polyprenyl-3-methyl-5-hydroxy-6-metoxy-1,4-benzoquinol methylase|uniref:Methyltransferase type 11 domain-containing protein n=1 Tax=Sulfobacillus benefaciens TaxID=453960 RepID=A0A2T2X0M2_9FIRM|nr:methyltransferase domain-containing protein [Bacillota bacterium]PSR28039.1 MAG: hypothetical protein C7B43_10805 [Sulfobacillus benefaciens]
MVEERLSPGSHDYIELLFHWHRYQVAAELVKGLRVLDLGIGTAYGSNYLAGYAEHVTGIDIDSQAVEAAQLQYHRPNLTFISGELQQHCFEEKSFDAVVLFEVIEHIAQDQQQSLIREIQRILKPNGLFLMSTPDHDRTKNFPEKNPYHTGELTETELRWLLDQNFAFSELYSQEVNAASLIWSRDTTSFRGYGIKILSGSSVPAPLDTVTRLTLIAQASNAPLEHSLASVCVEYERRILTELWDRSGHLQWQLQMKQEEEDRRQIEIAGLQKTLNESQDTIRTLQAQLDQANRDVGIISDTLLTMHESYRERLERLDNLEATVQEINPLRQRIAELETELNVVYQSRSWRLIKRYWRTMDSPGLGPLLKRMRRTMIKLRHRSSNSE